MIAVGSLAVLAYLVSACSTAVTYVSISSGDPFFVDPVTQLQYFPKGVSYQTWNRDIGQWQTNAQLNYDLRQMKLMGINSLYVTWSNRALQRTSESSYDFSKTDYLLSLATSYGIKLFVQLGSNVGSDWWLGMSNIGKPDADPGYLTQYATNEKGEKIVADQISYENAISKTKYQEFLKTVVTRYKTNTWIAAWIIGDSYAYTGVWDGLRTGYDNSSVTAYQRYLNTTYSGKISLLNAAWNSSYTRFDNISSPETYDRNSPAWYDFTQWKQTSIATFVCQGIAAIQGADPNHLVSYSSDGLVNGGLSDWMYDGSDVLKVASTCPKSATGIDFISLNTFIQAGSIKYGLSYSIEYVKRAGLPILITEVGISNTQPDYNITEQQQADIIVAAIYDAVVAQGVMGVHVFHWHDRLWVKPSDLGYGLFTNDRYPKLNYYAVKEVFTFLNQMYFGIYNQVFDTTVAYDIALYYSSATDSIRMRYHSNAMGIFNALIRIGYRVRFMNMVDIKAGQYTKVKAIVLPRNERMLSGELAYLYSTVLAAGVHIYAEADLPGYQTPYLGSLTDFKTNLQNLFGVNIVQQNAFQDIAVDMKDKLDRVPIKCTPTQFSSSFSTGTASYTFNVWKYHKLSTITGTTVLATMTVPNDTTVYPAVVLKTGTKAKGILTAFPMGDINCTSGCDMDSIRSAQYRWYKAIFQSATGFNIQPAFITTGAERVQTSFLKIGDGTNSWYAIYISNWSDKISETVTVTSTLTVGDVVKDMLNGRTVLTTKSTGAITRRLDPLETVIYLSGEPQFPYIYISSNGTPTDLFPMLYTVTPSVDYDTLGLTMYVTLEVKNSLGISYGVAKSMVKGNGRVTLQLYLTDASLSAADKLVQSSEGVSYYMIAYLSLAESCLTILASRIDNVLVSWPLKPKALPAKLQVTSLSNTTLSWENHPVERLRLFRGLIAVFNSTKTAAIDPSHYKKVQGVVNHLINMGYKQSYLQATDNVLLDSGYLFTVILDTNTTQTSGEFLAKYMQIVILPGVLVMSDAECNAMWYLATNDQNSVVISTEGRVGMYKPDLTLGETRLASFFGMRYGTAADTAPTDVATLYVKNINHPSSRTFPKVNGTVPNVITGIAWADCEWGTPLGSVGNYPALVLHTPTLTKKGTTYLFNFDAATSPTSKELSELWKTVIEAAIGGSAMYKIRWELKCGRSSVIIGDDQWCPTGNGTVLSSMVTPNVCPSTLIPILTGYVYPWWSSNPWYERKGFYTSENDYGYSLTLSL